METIFDHNITKEELKAICGSEDEKLLKKIFQKPNISQRTHYEKIYDLYCFRGNKEKADEYAAKMPDDERKLWNVCYHDFTHIGK